MITPKKVDTNEEMDIKLDACFARIDRALLKVGEKVADVRNNGDAHSDTRNVPAFKKTREALRKLQEDPLLTESRDDINLTEEDAKEQRVDPKTIRIKKKHRATA